MSELDRPRSPRAAVLPLSSTSSPRQKSKTETIRARSEVPISSRTGTRAESAVKPQVSAQGGTMRKPVRAAAVNIPVMAKLPSPQQKDLDLPLPSPKHTVGKEKSPRHAVAPLEKSTVKEVSPVQSEAKSSVKEVSPAQSKVKSVAKEKSSVKEVSPAQSKVKSVAKEKSSVKEKYPRHAVAKEKPSVKETSPVQPEAKPVSQKPSLAQPEVRSIAKEKSPRHAVAPLEKSVPKERSNEVRSDRKKKSLEKTSLKSSQSETAATVQVFSQSESKQVSRPRHIVPPVPVKAEPSRKSKQSRLKSEPTIISMGTGSESVSCLQSQSESLQKSADKWETPTRRMKPKKRSLRKRSEQEILYEQYKVPKGSQLVRAGDRYYVVKKFQKMTPEEQQLERTELEMKILGINRAYAPQGVHFKLASPDESLVALSVRYQQYLRVAKSRMGSDGYKLMLVLGWVVTEGILCWLGIPAQHYVENQIAIFDLYQNRLIEMGELGGFGQDWSPMTWILVMSAVNAAILIGVNKFADGNGAQIAMRGVAGMITGNSPALNTNGEALSPEQQTGPNPIGDLMNNFMGGGPGAAANPMMSMIGKFLPQMFSGVTGGMQARATAGTKRPPRTRKGPTHS